MNKKAWATSMVVVMAGTLLAGCGSDSISATSGQADAEQELHLTIGDEVPSMDPSLATDSYSFDLLYNSMEGLVRLDKDGQAVPGMASSWEISQDGKTYTFHLRDAKWSNGDAVTSKDFVYSWKRTLDPKTASQYASMLFWIKGAQEMNQGQGTELGVQTPDDKTLVVTLNQPTPFFLNQMSFPTFLPLNQKFVEEKGKDFGTSPETLLTNGPFKVTSWQHEQSVTFEKNADYWDKDAVKLNKVMYNVVKDANTALNMYEAGEIDRVALVRDQVEMYKDKTDEFGTQPELTNGYLTFNPKVKGLDNAKIRTALTWAIDRDMYADIVYGKGTGTVAATGFVPNGTKDSAGGEFRKTTGEVLTKHTAEEAKKLLEEGMKEAGLTAADLKFQFMTDDSDVARKASEFIQEQWRSKLGVEIQIDAQPFKLRLQREQKKDFQIGSSLWGADYNDPMTFLDLFVTNGDFNQVSYSNKEYDSLITAAKNEADVKKRAQLLGDAEKLLMKDMPVGPLFFRSKAVAMKPYVKNFVSYPAGVGYELKNTYIQGKN